MDNKKQEQRKCNPEDSANFFSRLTYAWVFEIFHLRSKRELETSDLYNCSKEHSSQTLGKLISHFWNKEEKKFKGKNVKNPSLLRVLLKCFGKELLVVGFCQGFNELFIRIMQVIQFAKVLNYFNPKSDMSETEIYFWALGFAACIILNCVIDFQCGQYILHLEMKLSVSCSALLYRKCLRLSKFVEESDATVGQIINVLSNDMNNFHNAFFGLHFIWIGPIQAIIVTVITYQHMNMSSFVGTLILFLFIPLQGYIGKRIKHWLYKLSLRTDKRLSLMEEIISGIQVIKMYAWEKSFAYLVNKARAKEINVVRKISYIDAITVCCDNYIPRLCIFAMVLCYVLFGNHISMEQVYIVTAFYNILRFSVNVALPIGMQRLARSLVSIKRVKKLMMHYEMQNTILKNLNNQNTDPSIAVKLCKASAKWSPDVKKCTLESINFTAECGTLSAIVGKIGSGKSSLLHLLLNELPLMSGSIQVSGKVVYVSQQPWVFASSIRQNILFGLPMNKSRYKEVIKVCQLDKDFAMFPSEDQTLIGERGINLSGGQKARINLARAVYSDADIYLLDDPLSAVDNYVSRKIFEECICKYLKEKTRILVTHQLQYLKSVDRIVVLNNGLMQMDGSFSELSHNSEFDWMKVLNSLKDDDSVDEVKKKMEKREKEDEMLLRRNSVDQEAEEIPEHRTVGKTPGKVYLSYLKAAGGTWIVSLVIVLGILYQLALSSGEVCLSQWVNAADKKANGSLLSYSENMWYIQTYSFLTLATIVLTHAFYLALCEMCMRSSKNLHSLMFFNIMRTAMSFFHENPSGRILNRFSKDIGVIDREMPLIIIEVAQIGLLLLSVLIINISINVWLLIPTVIIGTVFYVMRIFYMRTSFSLKRLQAINQSPVFSHVNATLQGLTTIRALKAEKIVTEEFDNYQNTHSSAKYLQNSCMYAFIFYLQFLSDLYIVVVVYFFIFMRNNVSAGSAGLVITQCLLLSKMLYWGLKQTTELENLMTSVERIIEYSELDQEPSLETEPEKKPPAQWPSEGRVEFKDVSLSYQPSGAFVLKDLNFVILPKEKIGIVGRTGAGKSSLIAALYRLAYLKGEICIDGIATDDIGLHDLRSNISIIPQEPLLFAGSLRSNLDPFENYSDDELWQALAEVELKSFIIDLNAGLEVKVSDGGSNFSIGQRQLLCLARAIIRNNKILILDEATANVDLKTDEFIQKTIRKRFQDCTVFIIAHRLNTVMDCDKFIVMDSGTMVEFGHPHELLKNNEGHLYNMVLQSGSEMANVLTQMAEKSYKRFTQ